MRCNYSRTCDPRWVAGFIARLTFGLTLIFVGAVHYMQIIDFVPMVGKDLGVLEPLGRAWGFLLPGLFIAGGVVFVLGVHLYLAAWFAGIALGSIAVGMLLKTVITQGMVPGATLGDTMPAAANAFVWLLVYFFVVKYSTSCCGPCASCTTAPSSPQPPAVKKAASKVLKKNPPVS